MTEKDHEKSNVVPLGVTFRPPAAKESAVALASVAEDAETARVAEHLDKAFDSKNSVSAEERFILARNLRDFVYRLEAEGKLDVKEVANRVRGPATPKSVRALQDYVAPKGVDDYATFLTKHTNRNLAGKPSGYKAHALAAAEIAKVDRNEALLALGRGSSFWPDAAAFDDEDRKYALQIASVLADLRNPLDAIMPLRRYFATLEKHRILPTTRNGSLEFAKHEDFDGWDHLAMPAVPLAYRLLESRAAVMVIPSDDDYSREQLDAVFAAGRGIEATATRRCDFSVAISGFRGRMQPVGLFSHAISLSTYGSYRMSVDAGHDRFQGGWHNVSVEGEEGEPVRAAWRLVDWAEDEDDDDHGFAPEPRPDIRIKPLTVDFLLRAVETGWHDVRRVPGEQGLGWRYRLDSITSRLGSKDSVAGLIERGLVASKKGGGLVGEMTERYRQLADALERWKAKEYAAVERALDDVKARLAPGAPLPGDE